MNHNALAKTRENSENLPTQTANCTQRMAALVIFFLVVNVNFAFEENSLLRSNCQE